MHAKPCAFKLGITEYKQKGGYRHAQLFTHTPQVRLKAQERQDDEPVGEVGVVG